MARRNKVLYVQADALKVHPTAQRKLVPVQVKKVMADLDLDAIGTLHVVDIDGQLWIIDGQHRWTALIRHGLGEWKVRCEVHEDVKDHARASALFLKLNNKATVATFDKYQNEVEAGEPIATASKESVEKFGLKIDRQSADGHVACVTAIKKVYVIDGGQTLEDTLAVVTNAWGHRADAVEGKLIEGLATVLARFNGELDRDILKKKLAKYPGGPSGLLGDAKGLKKIRRGSLSKAVAEMVVETYNSGRREANKLTLS